MKKWIALVCVLLCMLALAGFLNVSNREMVAFHGRTFYKADLSEETLVWLEWYNALSETEQLAISFIPQDLYKLCGYGSAEAVAAETN